MTNPFESQLAAAMKKVQEQLDTFQARQEAITSVVGVGQSQDGLVTVRMGTGGVIEDLELTPRVRRPDSGTLRVSILEAISAASAKYAEALAEIMPDTPSLDPERLMKDFGVD